MKYVSFASRGNLVLTDCEGYSPIEELHEGDLIKTYAAETQTESQSAVKEVVAGRSEKIVKINDMIAASPRQQILCDGMFQSAEALRLVACSSQVDTRQSWLLPLN